MKYFWLLRNDGAPDSLVADVIGFKDVDDLDLCIGRPVDQWDESSFVAVGERGRSGPPDDVLQTAAAPPIFSSRLQTRLEQAGIGGIQYLHTRVVEQNGMELDSFAVANVLVRISALDTHASTLSRYPADYFIEDRRGAVSSLRRPVLRWTPALDAVHIFRLEEYLAPIFVSQRFRDVWRLGGFTGVGFEEVSITRPK